MSWKRCSRTKLAKSVRSTVHLPSLPAVGSAPHASRPCTSVASAIASASIPCSMSSSEWKRQPAWDSPPQQSSEVRYRCGVLQSLVLEPAHALLVWARPVFAEDLHRKNLLRCPTASVAELHVRDHTSHWTPVLRRGSGCAVVGTDHGVPALLMGRGERYQSLDLLVRLGEVNVGNPLRFLHSQPRVEVSDWYRVYGGTEHGEFTLAIELYDDDGFMLLRKQTTFDATQQWAKASVAVPSHEFPQVRVQALCDVGPIKTPRDVVLLVPRLRRGCEYESYSMHQATSHRWKQLPRLVTRRGQGCQTACTS